MVLVCAGIDISSGFNQQAGQMDVGVRAGYVECSQSLRVTLVDAHSQLHKQLDHILRVVLDAEAERGALLRVDGEPGVGVDALLEQLVDARDVVVLDGHQQLRVQVPAAGEGGHGGALVVSDPQADRDAFAAVAPAGSFCPTNASDCGGETLYFRPF